MIDETNEDMLSRQRDAQRIVAEETIRKAFERVKDKYIEGWKMTQPADGEKREFAYMLYKAACDVWAMLERDAKSAHVRDLLKAEDGGNG